MRSDFRLASDDSGNILFLILIAVALFAALSYAATYSTRSGGTTEKEAWQVQSSQVTQYPVSVAASVQRMVLKGGDPGLLEFNPPEGFDDLNDIAMGVFHPQGGAATYAKANPEAMADGLPGTWYFNAEFEIQDIGKSVPNDFEGNEIIAFLPGIKDVLCDQMNARMGLSGDIDTDGNVIPSVMIMMDSDQALPSSEEVLGDGDSGGLAGKAFGCFKNEGDENIYFHVLLER